MSFSRLLLVVWGHWHLWENLEKIRIIVKSWQEYSMRLDHLSSLEAILGAGSPGHLFSLVSGLLALKIYKLLKVTYISTLIQVYSVYCT